MLGVRSVRIVKPMGERDDFVQAYFIQTRAEIENEKRARDVLLNFAVIVLGGGTAIAIGQSKELNLGDPLVSAAMVAAIVIIDALMWTRREKLRQIANRWTVLARLVKDVMGEEWAGNSLEADVEKGLDTRRYSREDLVLNLGLSVPAYLLGIAQISDALTSSADKTQGWRIPFWLIGLVIVADVVLTVWMFRKPLMTQTAGDPADEENGSNPPTAEAAAD